MCIFCDIRELFNIFFGHHQIHIIEANSYINSNNKVCYLRIFLLTYAKKRDIKEQLYNYVCHISLLLLVLRAFLSLCFSFQGHVIIKHYQFYSPFQIWLKISGSDFFFYFLTFICIYWLVWPSLPASCGPPWTFTSSRKCFILEN